MGKPACQSEVPLGGPLSPPATVGDSETAVSKYFACPNCGAPSTGAHPKQFPKDDPLAKHFLRMTH